MQDFPAAHSMDTEWFAVDADGNIGIFDSGEGGAVPESNYRLRQNAQTMGIENWFMGSINTLFLEWSKESSDRLIHLNISAEQILLSLGIDPQNLDISIKNTENISPKILPSSTSTPWIDEYEISNPKSPKSWGYPDPYWLLLVSGNEANIFNILKHHSLGTEDYIVRFSGEPALIFLTHCPPTTLQMLFLKSSVRYALPLKAYRNGLATLLGLFSYWHDYQAPHPYECDGQPIYPLKLSDLPEKLQDVVTWNWFDTIQFPDSRTIQPIEHMRCNTWSSNKWWVDTQGNERKGHPYDRS